MKIALTADVHLKRTEETPERYKALENILYQLKIRGIDNLIIAGDLFDKDFYNYSEFDRLCKDFSNIKLTIILGNHDYRINSRFFTASNIEVIDDIKIKELDGLATVLIPYDATKSIDEILSEYNHVQKIPERWILIGHGDYITGNRELNHYEPGIYMPLTTKSIIRYNPLKVFLGHIHKPSNFGRVFYPGSPCGLDITETGKRKFLIYDTKLDSVEEVFVSTEKIYFNESIIMLPFEEEALFLKRCFDGMIKNWGLSKDELNNVVLRLSIKGYVNDLKETMNLLLNILSSLGINLYDKDGLDLSGIKVLKDLEVDRLYLLERIQEKIENLNISKFYVSREKILEKAMELIFKD
ncbi:MAG: metallophosphoesterase family protein [Thermodesulfovibrio sp.]|nr:metallophosphoesterase family protein [Thermodesulfovibrio sp.]